ncbi:type II toxin-antitoxin system VapC family toxin [bacterium]|nr:type II toxin-antitoxin system VapC family toxin [bacterium]
MSRELFVDSSAWYALADIDDKYHNSAKAFFSQCLKDYARLITSNCVVGETYTLIRTRLGYRPAWEFITRIRSSSRLEVIFINEVIESEAYKLLRRFQDKDFSYVDGTSFVLMKERKITEAFAYDKHFLSAGFIKLPYI